MAYNLLVPGPMRHRVGDHILRESNTARIGEILDQMSRALGEGGQRRIMREVEERALEKLLASFKRNLLYHIDMEHEATRSGFHYVPLPELPAVLRRMGVL